MRRKDYITPIIQENEAQCSLIVAVSIIDGTDANPDSPVLAKENDNWNIWEE
jgi:hypothetical protein